MKLFSLTKGSKGRSPCDTVVNRQTRMVCSKDQRLLEGYDWRHAKLTPQIKRDRAKAMKWLAQYG